jgi:hypothetical protein
MLKKKTDNNIGFLLFMELRKMEFG